MGLKSKNDLVYDEQNRRYTYKGKELKNVTDWVDDRFCIPFERNKRFIVDNTIKNNRSRGIGISDPGVLRDYWKLKGDESSYLGKSVHCFAQMLHLSKKYNFPIEKKTKYSNAVVKAYDAITKKWDILYTEKKVYSLEYHLIGRLDMLLQHKETKELGIVDWKTTSDMKKTHDNFINELKGYKNNPLNKATIQLLLYDILGKFNIHMKNMFIVQLFGDGNFSLYKGRKLINCKSDIMEALESRKIKNTNVLDYM